MTGQRSDPNPCLKSFKKFSKRSFSFVEILPHF